MASEGSTKPYDDHSCPRKNFVLGEMPHRMPLHINFLFRWHQLKSFTSKCLVSYFNMKVSKVDCDCLLQHALSLLLV